MQPISGGPLEQYIGLLEEKVNDAEMTMEEMRREHEMEVQELEEEFEVQGPFFFAFVFLRRII